MRVLAGIFRFVPLAFGGKNAKTTLDQLRQVMAHVPVGYRQTQRGHYWKLRVGQQVWRKRKAS